MIRRVAVIGATGQIGRYVTIELVNAGFTVRALVRNPEKSRGLLPGAVEVVKGDLQSIDKLHLLFDSCQAVYVNLSVRQDEKPDDWHAETDGLANVIRAAKATGIQRIAMISSLVQFYQGMNGFSWWAFDVKKRSIVLLKESGIPHTIFYPSTFHENFEWNYKVGKTLLLAGKAEAKQYFISARDFGRQVARSFQLNQPDNKEYAVQGPEGFTTEEACRVFKSNYSRGKLVIRKAPLGLLKFFGLFVRKLDYGAHIIEALNKYPENFESSVTWEELGKPTITLKDYAASL